MIDIKFEITIQTEGMGIGGKEAWEKMIKDALNEILVFSHCNEAKFITWERIY